MRRLRSSSLSPQEHKRKTACRGNDGGPKRRIKLRRQLKIRPLSFKKKERSQIRSDKLVARIIPKKIFVTPMEETLAKKWSGHEEICVGRALMEASSAPGIVNMQTFYRRAKGLLNMEVSNRELSLKFDKMRERFREIESTNVPEHRIAFRSPQEPALFKIWQRVWGNSNNGDQNLRVFQPGNPTGEYEGEGNSGSTDSEDLGEVEDDRKRGEEAGSKRAKENGGGLAKCCEDMLARFESRICASLDRAISAALNRAGERLLQAAVGGCCGCTGSLDFAEFDCLDQEDPEMQRDLRKLRAKRLKLMHERLDLLKQYELLETQCCLQFPEGI